MRLTNTGEKRHLEGGEWLHRGVEAQPLSCRSFLWANPIAKNFPTDMDNKSTKTSIHTHTYTLTRLPLYHNFLFVPFYRIYTLRVERWQGSRLRSDIRDLFVHFYIPIPLTPRKKIGAAHANKEIFLFLFLENLSSTILLFLARTFFFLYTYPFFAALFSPASIFLSPVWCHFFSGAAYPSAPVTTLTTYFSFFFFFSFSYLSGASSSSPSLKCITVRRVSHTILQWGDGGEEGSGVHLRE